MSKSKKPDGMPDKDAIRRFIRESSTPVTKREIARAFGIKGEDRRTLNKMLRELEKDGAVEKGPNKGLMPPDSLPRVCIVEVSQIDTDGDIIAKPVKWEGVGKPPKIYLSPGKRGHGQIAVGDRALARLERVSASTYDANVIKRLDSPQGQAVGVFRADGEGGGWVEPAEKRARNDYRVPRGETNGAKDGELVVAEFQPTLRAGPPEVRIMDRLGDRNDPRNISLIAIHTHSLPHIFPPEAVELAEKSTLPKQGRRADLRDVPLVTIDGADARDYDDAVWAAPDDDAKNAGGWKIMVAIADVAHYVRPGDPLDVEARRRGNSTYFPDKVVPMLPEALSNGLCSLVPQEERACLVAQMRIDKTGRLVDRKVVRGIMRSAARLVYEQVQAARDGNPDDVTGPLMDDVIKPLYGAFKVLLRAREKRGALELDLPERKIIIGDDGHLDGVETRVRLDSHKMIEEFMILANVAVAEILEERKHPCIYRIHDRPDAARLDSAREFLSEIGISLAKGQVTSPAQINGVLKQAEGRDEARLINEVILRTQSQAVYSTDNLGHFGLALRRYAHFTSPIRRYADLVVHRSLVRALGLGDGALDDGEKARMEETAQHISTTERRSMEAERDAVDRFTAAWLESRVGAEFMGHINGVTKFGLFVTLDENGADGIVPIRTLPDDYYVHNEDHHALIGRRTGRTYRLCAPIKVKLVEADGLTGSTVFNVTDDRGAEVPGFQGPTPGFIKSGGKKNKSGRMKKKMKKKYRTGKSRKEKVPPANKKNKGKRIRKKKKKNNRTQ